MMRTEIINTQVVTMDQQRQIYQEGYIRIAQGEIVGVGPMTEYVPKQGFEVEDGTGRIVIPGMINTHTHLGLSALRSLGEDIPDRLRDFLFPAEMAFMTPELTVKASLFSAVESLKAGVTTVADMYYFTDEVAKALDNVKIRAFCGQTIMEENACDRLSEEQAIQESVSLIEKWHDHPLISIMLAPHSTITVTEESLKKVSDIAKQKQVKWMMHISEMDYEVQHFQNKYNCTPIAYLDKIGALNEYLISVHSIFAQGEDFELLARKKVTVAHCLLANMKSGKGIMDLKSMQQAQVVVGLGTDGPVSGNTLDLFSLMKFLPMAHKTNQQDRAYLTAQEVFELATIGGAKVLGIDNQVGSLEIGKRADLVVLNPNTFNMSPVYDVYAAIVYGAQPHNVQDVMIDGTWVLKNQQCLTVDEQTIFQDLLTALHPIRDHFQ